MKRTWQPSKISRQRKLGFRARTGSPGGRNVLRRRRFKGRLLLSVQPKTRGKRARNK